MIPTLVLVEGESDAEAVRALATLIGCDLDVRRIQVSSAGGVTNFVSMLSEFVRLHPRAGVCGLYDIADERHVRRAVTGAARRSRRTSHSRRQASSHVKPIWRTS